MGFLAIGTLGVACSTPMNKMEGMQSGDAEQAQRPEFQCSDFNYPVDKKFDERGEKWREIGKGLNLEGICQNDRCECFKKSAFSKHGFDPKEEVTDSQRYVFDIGPERMYANCPMCNTMMRDVNKCYFMNCKYTYFGIKNGEHDAGEGNTLASGYRAFEDSSGNAKLSLWSSLTIIVHPLDYQEEPAAPPVETTVVEQLPARAAAPPPAEATSIARPNELQLAAVNQEQNAPAIGHAAASVENQTAEVATTHATPVEVAENSTSRESILSDAVSEAYTSAGSDMDIRSC